MAGNLSIVNGSKALEYFLSCRLLALGGWLGSGKTLLAFGLARWLYLEGFIDGVLSNVPWDEDWLPRADEAYRAALILDEGGIFNDARGSATAHVGYGIAARKLDCYWIQPSKQAVDKRGYDLYIERLFDLWVLDMWVYQWEIGGRRPEKGKMFIRNYREVWGKYDSFGMPSDDGGILEAMKEALQRRSVVVASKWAARQAEIGLSRVK